MQNKLWTKDFSLITIATILSAIGGEAINLPISLLVFDQTQSTLLASIIMVCGMLPDLIFPILIAPMIDRGSKKKWIISLDLMLMVIYGVMGVYMGNHQFSYILYVCFVLMVGTISVFYRLSYSAWFPELIPLGMEQKGYAVSGTIYPIIIIMMAPISTFLYKNVSINHIFLLVAVILFLSILTELGISKDQKAATKGYSKLDYVHDLKEGFTFLKKEKGIRNIYSYMSITSGASEGVNIMTQAYYQTQPWLSVTMLGMLKSTEMIGRFLGGCVQYKIEVPVKKRYALTKFVYSFYNVMDAILLFLPYPLMLVNRFFCGALGTTSATIRETAVQSYLPSNMRARVNALFSVIFAIGGVLFQLITGFFGNMFSYQLVTLGLSVFTIVCMVFLIAIPKKENRPIYEAVRTEDNSEEETEIEAKIEAKSEEMYIDEITTEALKADEMATEVLEVES